MTPDHGFRDYSGRNVLALGLGTFGGASGAVRFLASHGAKVTVVDRRPAAALAEAITALKDVPIAEWRLGSEDAVDFAGVELVVGNPAIRRDHPAVQAAFTRGISVTSEMNLFWQHQRGDILAVTGSNGKSTTTAMLHAMMSSGQEKPETVCDIVSSAGCPLSTVHCPLRIWLGGNIGGSLLPVVDEISPGDSVVLELSSFQLTDLDRLGVSPRVSVVTNFSPNHLDWHDTLDHYRWAKHTMLRWQSDSDIAVLNGDDADVAAWPTKGRRLLFGLNDHGAEGTFLRGDDAVWRFDGREDVFPIRKWLKLPGRHNLANALAASAAALAWGATLDHVRIGLENYVPLPHRLQFVGEVEGRKFYNDSLATTPESAMVGMQSFAEPVILLAGGYDKHVDLTEMARAISESVKAVALMGQTGPQLRKLIISGVATISDPLPDFRSALDWAWRHSSPGDVILLSPGCASYDWFRNFADRGEQFMQFVRELAHCKEPRTK